MRIRFAFRLALAWAAFAACSSGSNRGEKAPPPPLTLPPPTMEHISPGAGISGVPFSVEVFGSYFRDPAIAGRSDRDGPTVVYSRIRDLDGKVVDGPAASGVAVVQSSPQGAAIASFTMDASSLPTGVYSLSLRTIAGLEVRRDDAFLILPRPAVTSIDQSFFCDPHMSRLFTSQPRSEKLGINGTNLFKLTPSVPGVALTARGPNSTLRSSIDPDSVSGCRPVPFSGGEICFLSKLGLICNRFEGAELCSRVEARLPGDIDLGTHMVVAVVPPMLGFMAPDATFDLFRDIFIESNPPTLAGNFGLLSVVDSPLSLPVWFGLPFVIGPGVSPTVRIGSTPLAVSATGCAPLGLAGLEACQGLTATVPQGFPAGAHVIDVTTAAGCTGTASLTLAAKPVIDGSVPLSMCGDDLQVVRVEGTGFASASILVDAIQPSVLNSCTARSAGLDCILGAFSGSDRLSLGTHQLIIENRSSPPVRSEPATLTVTHGPPVVGEPSRTVIYSRAVHQLFVPVSNVTGRIVSARIVSAGFFSPSVAIPVDVAAVPGGAQVLFPAVGGKDSYFIEVSDETPCAGRAVGFVTATDDPIWRLLDFESGPGFDVYTVSVTADPAPPLAWLENDGHPGSSVGARRDQPGPEWYFDVRPDLQSGTDVGLVRFDLRARGSGDPAAAPAVVLLGPAFQLEHATPAPAPGVWTHYELSLLSADGWTYRDAGGARPAQVADLHGFFAIRIPGSWWSGAGEAALDNVAVELAR
jgi:hypothetical protein